VAGKKRICAECRGVPGAAIRGAFYAVVIRKLLPAMVEASRSQVTVFKDGNFFWSCYRITCFMWDSSRKPCCPRFFFRRTCSVYSRCVLVAGGISGGIAEPKALSPGYCLFFPPAGVSDPAEMTPGNTLFTITGPLFFLFFCWRSRSCRDGASRRLSCSEKLSSA